MLSVKDCVIDKYLPTAQKVNHVVAHPVQSWIAIVDKNSGGQVWNWKTGEIIYAAQFGGIDESAMHYYSLQKMAEIDPAYWGAKTSEEQSISKTPTGKLRMIQFLDVEVLYWQRMSQLKILTGRSGDIVENTIPGALALQKERWLVIVCENKVLFYDFITHNTRELSKTALDAKNPVCVCILPGNTQSPATDDVLIAVGCTDGTIRIVSFSTFKTVVRLGYKSSSVTCLMSVYTSTETCLIVSGSQEGSLYVWDPFPAVAGSQNTSLPPITSSAKAHDAEILSLDLGYGTSFSSTAGIFSLGADRSVVIFKLPGLTILTKFKGPSQRIQFHSLAVAQPLEALPEKCPILIAGQSNVWSSTISGGHFHKIVDTANLMVSGNKKTVKIYQITLHPLHKHWLLLATSTGPAQLPGFSDDSICS